ncbi:MAG: DEAD/DEAH box helicase, partial [Lysinibacillus sp.]
MEFKQFNLSKEIVNALDKLDYTEPTEVQEKVLPVALENRDLVVKSQTGSGKTAAYAIPLCDKVRWEENKPQALVLTPTRELAVQVKEDFTNIGRFRRIKATAVYGKQPINFQKVELKQKTHVVVGTPGRVMDHIERGNLVLDKIEYLVIDEADEMLNMGFIDQVEAIIKLLPTNRVTMLFSATLPERVKDIALQYMQAPVDIEVQKTGLTTADIEHSVLQVTDEEKYQLLLDVATVENPDTCIIFCRTKDRVDDLFDKLYDADFSVDKIHGGMEQYDRLGVMKDFKRGDFRYLVATDVAARGIDIESVTHVINYDLPMEQDAYVHRTGRTGRAGQTGKAITFVTPFEDRFLEEIEDYIGFKIEEATRPTPEQIDAASDAFEAKMDAKPQKKKEKSAKLNQQIMKLYFN